MTGHACRLIINADDLGLSEGVNRGILEAHDAGAVTSASMMVNTPGFGHAAREALRVPTLGVGLHVNLIVGRPVAPLEEVPSLCDLRTGTFLGLRGLIARALAGRIVPAHVAAEYAAQFRRLRDTGLRITHVDSHCHTHLLPGIWRAVVDGARGNGNEVVRVPLEPLGDTLSRPAVTLLQTLFRASYRIAARGMAPPRHPDHFRGMTLTGRDGFLHRLLDLLEGLPPGVTELMVHPGYSDASLAGWVSLTEARVDELRALTSAPLRQRLGRGDIELIHFGQL